MLLIFIIIVLFLFIVLSFSYHQEPSKTTKVEHQKPAKKTELFSKRVKLKDQHPYSHFATGFQVYFKDELFMGSYEPYDIAEFYSFEDWLKKFKKIHKGLYLVTRSGYKEDLLDSDLMNFSPNGLMLTRKLKKEDVLFFVEFEFISLKETFFFVITNSKLYHTWAD